MQEEWRIIEEFPDYEISDYGNIRNLRFNRPKQSSINNRGMVVTCLSSKGKHYTRSIAILVATAFLGEPDNDYEDSVINLDGDKHNCRFDNLAWRTRHFAVRYNRERMIDPYPEWNKPFKMIETNERFFNPREPAIKYGLLESSITISLFIGSPVFPGNYSFSFW